jgi:hypothetical protein
MRFGHASEGVAAVEFALILPLLLFLYIGTMEASSLIIMDRRVQTVAGTLGDLVARSNKEITTAELNNYFTAASWLVQSDTAASLDQIVSSVHVKPDGGTEVMWSKKYPSGNGHPVKSAYELPKAITDIAKGSYVIVAEASTPYTPLLGMVYKEPINLYRENFFMPRFGTEIKLK